MKIIDALRQQQNLKTDSSVKDGIDITVCEFSPDKKSVRFAAAFSPLWIIRDNELTVFPADKFPAGIHHSEFKPFTLNETLLQSGNMIYLLSDGYADQFGGDAGKKFKSKQLQELLRNCSHESCESQKQILEHTLQTWKGNLDQVDDILIIGIRI
ncbi:MAG: hypothetical protein Fur0041_16800 [Bacteroidia bacterium]